MINDTSNFEEIRQHIFKVWGAETQHQKEMMESVIFLMGQNFLDFGTFPLKMSFDFYKAGFLVFDEVKIEPYLFAFQTVDFSPSFKTACERYKRPSDNLPREEDIDEYDQANGSDSDEVDIDFDDYRQGDVFLMSEVKLRSELKTRDHKWIIYRTPYRPETEDELRRPL